MLISEQRSELFSAWEKRLRGWDVYPYKVNIEPAFLECPKDAAFALQHNRVDDARHATRLSRFADFALRRDSQRKPDPERHQLSDILLPECRPYIRSSEVTELHLVLPPDIKTQRSLMSHIFTALTFIQEPLSFEAIGTSETIAIVLACAPHDAEQVREQLIAHEPECVINETTNYLVTTWLDSGTEKLVVEFGLEYEVMRPLATKQQSHDSLTGVLGALSGVQEGECALLQLLFQPATLRWSHELVNAVSNYDGSAFFADAPEMVPLAKEKTRSPLVACVIRAAASTASSTRAHKLVRGIGGSLMQLRDPKSNGLFPLENEEYDDALHELDVLARTTHRGGMLLNHEELTVLAHMPDASIRIPKLKRLAERTKAAPDLTKGHGLILGVNEHRGVDMQVTLDTPHRMRHMHLIGASGTGKSTMFMTMIRQDMEAGNGIAVLDPHGDLIDTVLKYVPEDRLDDVILFDPSDEEYPIGFNILDAHSELEKTLLASDLTSVFRRLSTSWGDQMNSVLANGINAMLESEHGGTLPTLRRFLVDTQFRKQHLQAVSDPENVFYWEREFPLLSGNPQGPVLTRLDAFLRPKPIRYMVAQKENKIDFGDVMQGKKIFLAKLAQGTIGAENSYLLGAFLITKLNQMAFSRQSLAKDKRTPFYLYIDEFHNFITPSMESILSGSRKYNMGLILAHQELRQLEGKDADVAASVLSNPFTRVCFRLGDHDAKRLQNGFTSFDASDLQSLGIGQAIARVERSEFDFNLSTPMLPDIDEKHATFKSRSLKVASQQRYGSPKVEIEALILSSLGKEESNPTTSLPKEAKSLPGRGGAEHKRLQQEIKRMGEDIGFRSTIEKPVRDENGKINGHVDVALERDDLRIAVEISVSTSIDHEQNNIQKCVDAGFDHVVLMSSNEALQGACASDNDSIHVFDNDQLSSFIKQFVDQKTRISGYTVETSVADNNNTKKTKQRIIDVLREGL